MFQPPPPPTSSRDQYIPGLPTPPKGYIKKLHYICLITLLPALPLIIPYSVIDHKFFPAFCLLPHGISAALAAYRLKLFCGSDSFEYQIVLNSGDGAGEGDGKKLVLKKKVILAIMDLVLSLWLLTSVIVTFCEYHYGAAKYLIAYAMQPVLVNCVIHAYFFLLALPNPWKKKPALTLCPHCRVSLVEGTHSPSSSSATTPDVSDCGDHPAGETEGRPSIECVV